jgi:hypothetical protein
LLLCESLDPRQGEIGRGILERVDTDALQARAITAGMVTIRERAVAAVRTAQTSPVEVRRVLGGWT